MSEAAEPTPRMRTSGRRRLNNAIGALNTAMEEFCSIIVGLDESNDEVTKNWELDHATAGAMARIAAWGSAAGDPETPDVNDVLADAGEGMCELPTQIATIAVIVCLTSTPQQKGNSAKAADELDAALQQE